MREEGGRERWRTCDLLAGPGTAFKRSEMKLCSELGSLILNFTHIFTSDYWIFTQYGLDLVLEFRESVICHHRAHDLVGRQGHEQVGIKQRFALTEVCFKE